MQPSMISNTCWSFPIFQQFEEIRFIYCSKSINDCSQKSFSLRPRRGWNTHQSQMHKLGRSWSKGIFQLKTFHFKTRQVNNIIIEWFSLDKIFTFRWPGQQTLNFFHDFWFSKLLWGSQGSSKCRYIFWICCMDWQSRPTVPQLQVLFKYRVLQLILWIFFIENEQGYLFEYCIYLKFDLSLSIEINLATELKQILKKCGKIRRITWNTLYKCTCTIAYSSLN